MTQERHDGSPARFAGGGLGSEVFQACNALTGAFEFHVFFLLFSRQGKKMNLKLARPTLKAVMWVEPISMTPT